MGFISPDTLTKIREASDIVDVIGTAIPLKRAGANFLALCPFHKEKTPSFNVNPQKQFFHCYGCHKGGDVFSFIREYENLSFVEAVKRLAERAKIPLDLDRAPSGPGEFQKDVLLKIHDQIALRWQSALQNDGAGEYARQYLAKRGVSQEAIKLFRLGYAPDAWDDTVHWATSKGFDLPLVEKAGLIVRREAETRYYDRFRGRLIFPICDEQGRVVAFSGRILSGDEKTAKYVNSPETPIFTKGKIFYGLDKSKRALLDAGFALVCEGQLDLIATFMAGVQNVVAPQGTAFTADHARILKRYVEEVVLCFDSDNAGRKAAVRVLDNLLASGLAIRVATLPAPHDPDSFVKQFGAEAFRELIGKAEGFFDFYLQLLCGANDTRSDKGRLAIVKAMADAVNKTQNVVLRDTYAQKTALRLGVIPEAVRLEFRKVSRGTEPAETPDESSETAEAPRLSPQELWLLKLSLHPEADCAWLRAHLDPAWIPNLALRKIISMRLDLAGEVPGQVGTQLLDRLDSKEARSLLTEALTAERPIPNPQQQLQDYTLKLRNQQIDRELALLINQASHPEIKDGERHNLLLRQQELRALKKTPLTALPE